MTRHAPAIRSAVLLPIALTLVLFAGCGAAEEADNAVEAQEHNTAELAGVRYRVVLFRQLNVHDEPDDALWTGPPPESGSGLYMVVLRACADAEPARSSARIHLEDAYGQRFAPRTADTADEFAYSGQRLEPGECLPARGGVADRVFDGAALVFDVPYESVAERPIILEIAAPTGDRTVRIQLDL